MAFLDLTTCREVGYAVGPITWMTLQRYAEVYEVEGEQREDLFYHVQKLDEAYLKWSRAKEEKKAAQQNPPPSKKPRRSTPRRR
jgi:hypothetical protein